LLKKRRYFQAKIYDFYFQFGKRQAFGIGKELREFVGYLVGKNYFRNEAKFYTSSASRCQMTLQALLAGFYPPDTFAEWNPALDWTPVPYIVDDPMLRMYAVSNCPKSDEAWAPIINDMLPKLMKLSDENQLLLNYISNNTGWKASISSASDLADNLIEIELYGAKYPEWIENPTLDGYDKERLKREVLALAEKHQIECTEYEPCRNIMGGVWLENIIMNLQKVANGENAPKIIVYTSHTEVTLSVMKLMHIARQTLPTSAGFVIEYRNEPNASVRLLAHDPIAIDDHVIYQVEYEKPLADIADRRRWIPVDKFISLVQRNTITDWEQACGRKNSGCGTESNKQLSSSGSNLNIVMAGSSLTALITLYLLL
uniref:Histidine acid phosphatase n=1 Tax=Toxocara canis TaxID=6265 RepID=A0A183V3I1_TOXCA